ncbi:MAG: hypothetical protein WC728_09335 [Elusimicrobiota bacterium]
MNNNNNEASSSPKPAGDSPEADIPELKEKEKEKKGAGAPWYSGSGAGPSGAVLGSGNVVRVGASMARPGLLGSGRIAAALARLFGGPSTLLGGLFSSQSGGPLVLLGMLLGGGLLAAAGLKLMGAFSLQQQSSLPMIAGMDSSNIVIDRPKDRSLGYLAAANEGEIAWDKDEAEKKDSPATQEETPQPEVPPVEQPKVEPPKFEMPDVNKLMKGGLKADDFVKKMTQDPGALHAGAGPRMKDGAGFNLQKTFSNVSGTTLGKTKRAMRRNKLPLRSGLMGRLKGKSDRAMGQLKLARNMSAFGAKSTPDSTARQYSTDAFEQGKTIGGQLQGVDDGSGIVVPAGDGAPGVTDSVPDVPPGTNVTPYQSNVDAAKALDDSSAGLKNMGMMLIVMGLMLIVIGIGLLNCTTFPIGLMLIAAGMALIMVGMMLMGMSASQAQGAKDQGKNVEQGYGQPDQADAIDDCAEQAAGGGIVSEACRTSEVQEVNQKASDNTIQQDVANERNSNYTLQE